MSKELRKAAVEGFTGSFRLLAVLVATFVGTLISVLSSFAHHNEIAPSHKKARERTRKP